MSILSYFRVVPQALPDPAGPLSSDLSPSTFAEANAAVNGVQEAMTKKQGPYDLHLRCMACSFDGSTHYFLVNISHCGCK